MPSISSFFGLETTLRGLLAQQSALDVTSHNIANANTPGYSRQQAVLGASDALQVTDGTRTATLASLGTGVQVESYSRVRDQFLDLQYRAQNMVLGQQSATSNALSQVETALSEPGPNGISAELAQFWSAWGDVTNAPDNPASRQSAVDKGSAVATSIQGLYSQLTQAASDASAEYTSLTASPNGDVAQNAAEIASLNTAIKKAVASGDQPNDLLDRRDQILDQLSELGQVSVTDLGNGSINVNFGDAANPIVSDTTVSWPQAINNSGATPPTSSGGKLGALYDLFKTGGTIDSLTERPGRHRKGPRHQGERDLQPGRIGLGLLQHHVGLRGLEHLRGRHRRRDDHRHGRGRGRQRHRQRDRQPARRHDGLALLDLRHAHRQHGAGLAAPAGQRAGPRRLRRTAAARVRPASRWTRR